MRRVSRQENGLYPALGSMPTIRYTGSGNVITADNAAKLHIKGVEVTGDTANISNDGIDLDLASHGSYIEDNIIRNVGGTGIEISASDNITVINNQVENSEHGIAVGSSKDTIISHNTVENATIRGITTGYMDIATISNNTIISEVGATDKTDTAFLVFGTAVNKDMTFKDNTIEGDFEGALIDIDMDIEFTDSTGNDKNAVGTVGGDLCNVDAGVSVTGQISFTDGDTCP
jgi:parallel beta-helix repeat protein